MPVSRRSENRVAYLRTKLTALQKVSGRSLPRCKACGADDLSLLSVEHTLGRGSGALARRGGQRTGAHLYRAIKADRVDLTDLCVLCVKCNQLSACFGPDPYLWPSALTAEAGWVKKEIASAPGRKNKRSP
jgi:hypothetical protein